MKRVVCSLCIIVFAMIIVFGGGLVAFAGTYEEECDLVFRSALDEIFEKDAVEAGTVKVTKEPVYDLNLDQLGFIYLMEYETAEGFAFVINTNGSFDLTEFYSEAANPFGDYDGQKIYVSLMFYLVWQDNNFVETSSGFVLDDESLALLTDTAFYSADNGMTINQDIVYYISRTENTFKMAQRHPTYYPVDVANACVATAGANIIGFYDRFYESLIPNFTSYSSLGTVVMYKGLTDEAEALIKTLANYMGTNVNAPGTTINGFKTGMTRYVNEKGRNISYITCMQSGSLNYTFTKQKIQSGVPVVLFLDTYNVFELSNAEGKEYRGFVLSPNCHAMAGFGYSEITYTLTTGQVRTDKYIQVASGLTEQLSGYFNIAYNTQIDECYAIQIS